jgi:hypothetical protein
LASDTLLTTLHPPLEKVLQTVDCFEISCLGAPFSWWEKPRNLMGRDLDCTADVLMGFHRSTFSKSNTEFNSDLTPCDFWAFPTLKKSSEARNFEVIDDLQRTSRYPLDRRFGGPQRPSGRGGVEKTSQPLLVIKPVA